MLNLSTAIVTVDSFEGFLEESGKYEDFEAMMKTDSEIDFEDIPDMLVRGEIDKETFLDDSSLIMYPAGEEAAWEALSTRWLEYIR